MSILPFLPSLSFFHFFFYAFPRSLDDSVFVEFIGRNQVIRNDWFIPIHILNCILFLFFKRQRVVLPIKLANFPNKYLYISMQLINIHWIVTNDEYIFVADSVFHVSCMCESNKKRWNVVVLWQWSEDSAGSIATCPGPLWCNRY